MQKEQYHHKMKGQNYQWYILSVWGGREEKIIERIKSELEKKGWSSYFQEFKVVSDNQKKNILKGYILCRCHLTLELTRFFYQIPKVIGFLNHQWSDGKLPDPVSETVVKNFLTRAKEKESKPDNYENYEKISLNIGDSVIITKGEFINQEGKVIQLDKEKQKVKIFVESSGWEIDDVPVNFCQKVFS